VSGEFKNKLKITILVITHICTNEFSLTPKVCAMHVVATTTNQDSFSALCENLVQDFSFSPMWFRFSRPNLPPPVN